MPKTLSLGTILYMENPPATWVAIGNLTSVSAPGPVKGETEVTDYDSVAREFLATLPDNGEMSLSGYFVHLQAGQVLMWNDAVDAAAPARNWRLDFVRQDARFTFSGFVKSFQPSAGGTDDAYTFASAIRVTGAVTLSSIP